MEKCKVVATPLEINHQVNCTGHNCKEMPQCDYQSIIGALMYLSIATRNDILHSVAKLTQRNANPHEEYMKAVKRILRYLQGTVNMKLKYTAGETSIEGFVDADWGGDNLDQKSYTSFVFFIGNCLVSWQSKKQSCVALNSTEAEYVRGDKRGNLLQTHFRRNRIYIR